ADIDMKGATNALDTEELVENITKNTRKFFTVSPDAIYENNIIGLRQIFLEDLSKLWKQSARSEPTRAVTEKLSEALEDYWQVFNRLKPQAEASDSAELPPELANALDHLAAQSEIAYETVKGSIKDQVTAAAEKGQKAARVTWIAGLSSFLLGVIVFAFLIRSINDPLRRLTHG